VSRRRIVFWITFAQGIHEELLRRIISRLVVCDSVYAELCIHQHAKRV
jgi:hypothetical protein